MAETKYSLEFGAMSDPISVQIREQLGDVLSEEDAKFIDKIAEDLTFLRIVHILSRSEANSAEMRLMKEIKKMIPNNSYFQKA